MKKHLLTIALIFSFYPLFADGIFENFESGLQDPFNGISTLNWIGDVGDFKVTTAGWPVSPAPDFLGNNSIRALGNQELNSTILTDISNVFSTNKKIRWEVYVCGRSTTVTSTRGFSLILYSDLDDIDKIEEGSVNGYRLHIYDPIGYQDGLFLEKASGSGWEIIDYVETSWDIKLNQGWNIVVERESNGVWSWGFSNGAYNMSVSLTESIIDNDFTSGMYSGINWYSIASYSNSFGFDNFKVDPYTPNLWRSEAGSSAWSTASNWDDGVVPSTSSNIKIEAGINQPIIDENTSCGNLILEAGANLSIDSEITLSVNGDLMLQSDANGTASMIDHGTLSVLGSTTIQRFMKSYDPSVNDEYHFLSIPIADHAAENSLQNYYVYPYDESQNSWTALSSGNQLLKGKGYSVYYSGDEDHCIEFLGTPNSGNQSIAITASDYSGTSADDNWNLIGNPFPSPIDWDDVSHNHIEGAIYIWDAESCNYASYVSGAGTNFNDDGIIPAMQGFFVHASSSGDLTIPQTARVHNQAQYYLMKNDAENQLLRIQIKNQTYSDECVVRFKEGASESWDGDFDALKFLSEKQEVPQIFTLINPEIRASINTLPVQLDRYEIPLLSRVDIDGIYEISISNVSTLIQEYDMVLKDKFSGEEHKIVKDSCYQLNLLSGEMEQFALKLESKKTTVHERDALNISINVNQSGGVEIGNIPTEFMGGILNVLSLDGKEIYASEINNSTLKFSIFHQGIYILQLRFKQNVLTKKITIL